MDGFIVRKIEYSECKHVARIFLGKGLGPNIKFITVAEILFGLGNVRKMITLSTQNNNVLQ